MATQDPSPPRPGPADDPDAAPNPGDPGRDDRDRPTGDPDSDPEGRDLDEATEPGPVW